MKSTVLLTGHRGYLGSNLMKQLSQRYAVDSFSRDVRSLPKNYRKHHMVIHFAGPSDSFDFRDEYHTSTTMIKGTLNMIDIAMHNNCKFIFASSLGVEQQPDRNPYIIYKLAMEYYIKSVYNNYVILRIPRVYSKCRDKGLMKKIREDIIPEKDMSNVVEYIHLDSFLEQTLEAIDLNRTTYNYTGLTSDTIRDIKEKYG